MFETLEPTVALVGGALITSYSLWTAGHALIRKRSSRSAAGWVGLCLLFPLGGATLYWLIGQNRIFRRAEKLQERFPDRDELASSARVSEALLRPVAVDERELESLLDVARTADAITRRPLLAGNRVTPLEDGDATYPRMLDAIRGATETVDLCTYLFDGERTVPAFVRALAEAQERDVRVRVLLDGLGDLVAWRAASRALRRAGLEVALFIPPSLSERGLHINLRNHRKLMVVDGRIAFTGGINLRDVHEIRRQPPGAWLARDLHFELEGPAVAQLELVFEEDWAFATRRPFHLRAPRCEAEVGSARVRAIPDGPDEQRDTLKWIVIGSIGSARRVVRLMTPYFIPPHELEAALIAASLRGVEVRVLLPGTIDHRFVHWAARAMIGDLLKRGAPKGAKLALLGLVVHALGLLSTIVVVLLAAGGI